MTVPHWLVPFAWMRKALGWILGCEPQPVVRCLVCGKIVAAENAERHFDVFHPDEVA